MFKTKTSDIKQKRPFSR